MAKNIIKFFGGCSQTEVMSILKKADIFLLPSVAEILPVSLMEAQCIGLPVIATSVGAVSEVVVENKSAYLIPSKNPKAIEEKIVELLEDYTIWPEMIKCGKEHIQLNYNIDILNDRLIKLYEGIVSK